MKLTDSDRAEHLEWCRAFIDHHCIFRSPKGSRLLTGPAGDLNSWQYYIQVATLNQGFGYRIGLLFWDRFGPAFEREPFQICGCDTGGVPLICALQSVAYRAGIRVNVLSVKQQQKAFGLKNWFEGVVENLPVMLVDDIVASGRSMTAGMKQLAQAGLMLHPEAFSILSCKRKTPPEIALGNQKLDLSVLYFPDDFAISMDSYIARYGRAPTFSGTVA